MIRLDRLALPSPTLTQLQQFTEQVAAHLDPAKKAAELWNRANVRKNTLSTVRSTLEAMAAGIDRCMYCGDSLGTDIDHYRPKSIWPLQAFTWLNHLLSCARCNSTHKRDDFPLDELGFPMLIDPTAEDPAEHLVLSLASFHYGAQSKRGWASITLLGLNRPELVMGRQSAAHTVAMALSELHDAVECDDDAWTAETILQMAYKPFADVAETFFRYPFQDAVEIHLARKPAALEFLRTPGIAEAGLRALHDGRQVWRARTGTSTDTGT